MREPRITTASAELIALNAKRMLGTEASTICTLAAEAVEAEALA